MQQPRTIIALLVLTLAPVSARASSVYVVNYNNQFGTVDVSTGTFSPISALDPAVTGGGILGLVSESSGSLLGLDFNGDLDAINPTTGALSVIGATGLGINGFTIGSYGSQIFATDYSNNLYSINPATGAATLIGPTGIPPDHEYPFTTNPDGSIELCDESLTDVNGVLYAIYDEFALAADGYTVNPSPSDPSNAAKLYRIDPVTGIATPIASTGGQINSTFALDGTLYGFKGNLSASSPFPDPAFTIDAINTSTGALVPVASVDDAGGGIPGAVAVPTPEPPSICLLLIGLAGVGVPVFRRARSCSV